MLRAGTIRFFFSSYLEEIKIIEPEKWTGTDFRYFREALVHCAQKEFFNLDAIASDNPETREQYQEEKKKIIKYLIEVLAVKKVKPIPGALTSEFHIIGFDKIKANAYLNKLIPKKDLKEIHSNRDNLGILAKALRDELEEEEQLIDLDLKWLLEIMGITNVSILPLGDLADDIKKKIDTEQNMVEKIKYIINLGGSHWITVSVSIYTIHLKSIDIVYHDSMPKISATQERAKKEKLEGYFKDVLEDYSIKINFKYGKQTDDWSCGYRALKNLVDDLNLQTSHTAYNELKEIPKENIREIVGVCYKYLLKQDHLKLYARKLISRHRPLLFDSRIWDHLQYLTSPLFIKNENELKTLNRFIASLDCILQQNFMSNTEFNNSLGKYSIFSLHYDWRFFSNKNAYQDDIQRVICQIRDQAVNMRVQMLSEESASETLADRKDIFKQEVQHVRNLLEHFYDLANHPKLKDRNEIEKLRNDAVLKDLIKNLNSESTFNYIVTIKRIYDRLTLYNASMDALQKRVFGNSRSTRVFVTYFAEIQERLRLFGEQAKKLKLVDCEAKMEITIEELNPQEELNLHEIKRREIKQNKSDLISFCRAYPPRQQIQDDESETVLPPSETVLPSCVRRSEPIAIPKTTPSPQESQWWTRGATSLSPRTGLRGNK